MPNAALRSVVLPLEPAKAAALVPFGRLLGRAVGASQSSQFYAGSVRMARPVDFRCNGPVELQMATLSRRSGEVRYMERHFQHTQTFIPLGGKPFVLVVAPPCVEEMPDLAQARAFRFDGEAGFTLNLGVWHEFPFALEDQTDIIVVLSSQTSRDLVTKDPVTLEARGPDLDKKDIRTRAGVVLSVSLGETVQQACDRLTVTSQRGRPFEVTASMS